MKLPFHHIKHPEWLFDYFHEKIHYAFVVFTLAMIGMLWGTSNILTATSASWQWWGFLNSDFWQQNPTNANIMYALFGNGTPGSTAYTRLWNASCIPTNVQALPTNFSGLTWSANTIYIVNPWTYTLTSPIVMDNCSALLGIDDVIIKASGTTTYIDASSKNNIILDNIQFDWNSVSLENIKIQTTQDISLNNIKSYNNSNYWLNANYTINALINNSYFFKNNYWLLINDWSTNLSINNVLAFDNTSYGIKTYNADYVTINNTQTFNNNYWIYIEDDTWTPWNIIINNAMIYNNDYWIVDAGASWYIYNIQNYNNNRWIHISTISWWLEYYWYLHMFNNTLLTWGVKDIVPWSSSILDWWAWSLDISNPWFSYDRMTNPQNGSGQRLLSWTNRTWLRLPQSFDPNKKPIRYIFWSNILKQGIPIWYNSSTLEKYGSDWVDYKATKYIAEPESNLPIIQQILVNQYFGSWSTFIQNWQTNWCSLSAFQVKTLDPATFATPYNFEDHTLYILSGGEYRSAIAGANNGFVFNGNCIALIGTPTTRFTKSGWGGMNSILYANNRHNIIIDTIKVDALYYAATQTSVAAQSAIKFDGANNNSTINNVQAYNASSYGIYLGLNSHYNTIINSQLFNNLVAGIHLYYASNYNVITNTQTYNNTSYGIWLANWSNKNTMNNFQAYNNTIGVFWDLTTQENIINRSVIYNNSDAGIYLKNSSGNIFNDIRVYNNGMGIRTLYNSVGNKYYGNLELFANLLGNFEWTSGNDIYLSPSSAGAFPYMGILITWTTVPSCSYVTNPTLSGNSLTLLTGTCITTWFISSFVSEYNTYVNYIFGSNMYKQKIPVRYTNENNLIQVPSQYDSTKYIAEPFAFRETPQSWSDTTPPTTPTLTYPLSGERIFFVTFAWTASTDIGSWIEGYLYEIAEDTGFTNIINTGFITTVTWTLGSPNTDFDTSNGTYHWRMKAKDNNSNTSARSNIWYFALINFTNRHVTNTDNANLRTYYNSNEITLKGIKTWLSIWATIDGHGILYKNGTNQGTGALVQNGDDIYITMKSSSIYDTTISSVLTIANRTLEFDVTTKQQSNSGCTLSDDDRTTIETIFDSLVSNYSGDTNKFEEFLTTMKSMLADEIDFTNDCNLQYLEDLINSALGINLTGAINTWAHIAPNCKEYPVSFDTARTAYTSPIFKVITFFANRDSLGKYIDSKNPGDCHINTYWVSSWVFTNTDPSRHIAPNGKLYMIQYTAQWYTADEFIVKKYFTTISGLRKYIDSKNIPEVIRSHQVDTNFAPQTYIAPNGKSYTIYKTDRWYMSYKLIKVRYFPTLADIQYFININNKK